MRVPKAKWRVFFFHTRVPSLGSAGLGSCAHVAMATTLSRSPHLENGGSRTLAGVPELPPDAIFHINTRYNADEDARKLNLGVRKLNRSTHSLLILQGNTLIPF